MVTRTSSGIRNIHLFYSGFYVVIVEGPTDKPFWSELFPDEINGYKKKLKPVGGWPEVQTYIEQVLLNKGKFAVATDSDYRFLLNCIYQDSRIIETKYHSIENLMLCPSAITSIISTLSYELEYGVLTVNNWLNHFDEAMHLLMVADLIIEKNSLRKKCVGDDCSRFLISKNNPTFDTNKINCFIQDLNLLKEEFDEMAGEMDQVKPRFHIRGHFLFNAVLHFIQHEVKRIRQTSFSISNDSLYGMLIFLFAARIEVDPMLQAMREQALLAAEEVTNLLSQGN